MSNSAPNRLEGETSLFPLPSHALEAVHVDHFGQLPETAEKYRHILLMIDSYTRFTWLFPVKSTSTKETVEKLEFVFHIFGNPTNIISDRGTAFTSNEFTERHQIQHRKVAVASPWVLSNGLVERVNRFLKNTIIKSVDDARDWKQQLGKVQFVINNTYHSVVKSTPSQLMLGYAQRGHSDHLFAAFTKTLVQVDSDLQTERKRDRDNAEVANDFVREYNKKYRDASSRKPSIYKEGQYVAVRNMTTKKGESSKIKPQYKGSYVIHKVLGNNRYVVQDIPGCNITPKPLDTILSSDKIKSYIRIG